MARPTLDDHRPSEAPGTGSLHAAFREQHGARLFGFALLVALGDVRRAEWLADRALEAGAAQEHAFGEPQEASAWLRTHVARAAAAGRRFVSRNRGLAALRPLGVTAAAYAGLGALGARERAVLVADMVERLDPLDLATVAGCRDEELTLMVRRARRRYAQAAAASMRDQIPLDGDTMERVRLAARHAS